MNENPRFKLGEEVLWKKKKLVIQGIRNYQGYCWVYDFCPTTDTIVPFYFTGIAESEISPIATSKKHWWEFWK